MTMDGNRSATSEMSVALRMLSLLSAVALAAAGCARRAHDVPAGEQMMAKPIETKVLSINGRKYCYVDQGASRAVVMLHGSWVARDQYTHQIAALAAAGYRAICPYRAGMGGSDLPTTFSAAADVQDILTLTESLGIRKFVVVGHSHGANIARQVLLTRPEAVEAVVSVDGAFGRLAGEVRKLGLDRMDARTRALHEKNRGALEEFGRMGLWDHPSDWNIHRLKQWRAWHEQNADLKTRVKEKLRLGNRPGDRPVPKGKYCKVPLLVFAAGYGRIRQGDPEVSALAKRLPARDATLVVVTDSGHWVQQEAPEEVNEMLAAWLTDQPVPGSATLSSTAE